MKNKAFKVNMQKMYLKKGDIIMTDSNAQRLKVVKVYKNHWLIRLWRWIINKPIRKDYHSVKVRAL